MNTRDVASEPDSRSNALDEADATMREYIRRAGDPSADQQMISWALYRKSRELYMLGRPAEAAELCVEISARFAYSKDSYVRECLAGSLVLRSRILIVDPREIERVIGLGDELISLVAQESGDSVEIAEFCLEYAKSLVTGYPNLFPMGMLGVAAVVGFNFCSTAVTSVWSSITRRVTVPGARAAAKCATRLVPEAIRRRRRHSEQALSVSEAVIARLSDASDSTSESLAVRARFLAFSANFGLGRIGAFAPDGATGLHQSASTIGLDTESAPTFERFAEEEMWKPGASGHFGMLAFLSRRAKVLGAGDSELAKRTFHASVDARVPGPRGPLLRLMIRFFASLC